MMRNKNSNLLPYSACGPKRCMYSGTAKSGIARRPQIPNKITLIFLVSFPLSSSCFSSSCWSSTQVLVMPPVFSKMPSSPLALSSGSITMGSDVIYVSSSPHAGPSVPSGPGAHNAGSTYNQSTMETQLDFGGVYTEIRNLHEENARLKEENTLLHGQVSGITYISSSIHHIY